MKNSIVQILEEIGFTYSNDSLRKNLFKDYIVQIKPEDKWSNSDELFIYLFSSRFARIMHYLFTHHKNLCGEYMPRKLVKDNQDGCLSMVMMHYKNAFDKTLTFNSAGEALDLHSFSQMLDAASSPHELHLSFCNGLLGKFTAVIESVWVYLYLAKERGLSNTEIMKEFNEDCSNFYKKIKKPLDLELLDLYSHVYQEVGNYSV